MNIELTKEQFRTLLDVVYLGNWMTNSHRTEDIIKKYEDLQSYIFGYCAGFDMKDLSDEALEGYPSIDFEEEISLLIDEYDNQTFWDELSMNMATKKVAENNFEPEEAFNKIFEFKEEYQKEFEKNGVKNLSINTKG